MMNLNFLRKPSIEQIAEAELDEARRELMRAENSRDYADSMINYNLMRIARLEAILSKGHGHA